MAGGGLPDAAEIEASADDFRRKYAPDVIGPLNIARIVEKHLRIVIVPIPGLCRKIKTKGYVAQGGEIICIDAAIMKNQPEEYQQTIAHETCHATKHREQLPQAPFSDVEAVRYYHDHFLSGRHACNEYEANEWARRVLMPRGQLEVAFSQEIAEAGQMFVDAPIANTVLRDQLYRERVWNIFREVVAGGVAARFGVTASVADARIRDDGLWSKTSLDRVLKQARKAVGDRGRKPM